LTCLSPPIILLYHVRRKTVLFSIAYPEWRERVWAGIDLAQGSSSAIRYRGKGVSSGIPDRWLCCCARAAWKNGLHLLWKSVNGNLFHRRPGWILAGNSPDPVKTTLSNKSKSVNLIIPSICVHGNVSRVYYYGNFEPEYE